MMDADAVFKWVFLPAIKYPIFLLIPLLKPTYRWKKSVCIILVLYSIILRLLIQLNVRYKLRGKWPDLVDLPGTKCVITGGSNGLGLTIVEQLLKQFPFMTVIIVDISLPRIKHPRISFYQCDLSNANGVANTLEQIAQENGKIDILINNAGMRGKYQDLQDIDSNEINRIFQVNVFSPTMFIQRLAPKSDENRLFYLVTVASILGINAPARASTYGATKAALIALHESWTQENIERACVRSLLVLPGQLDTKMFRGFEPPREFLAPLVKADELALQIVHYCQIGMRGELCAPLYANFMYVLKSLPYSLVHIARRYSGMDTCLPSE